MSFTMPMISISMRVPGSFPNPRCKPRGFLPGKNFLANFSLIITVVGSPVILLRAFFDLVIIRHPAVPPCNNGHAQRGKVARTDLIHKGLGSVFWFRRRVSF